MLIVVVVALFSTVFAFGEVKVTTEHNTGDNATPKFTFKNVPAPAADNAAAKAKFTIVAGEADGNSADLSVLNDGKLPDEEDQPASNFFFADNSEGGRLLVDLGGAVAIKQVNTYSWHPSTRGPQVFKLYASNGTADGFNAKPGSDVNPEKAGWKLIATVDTRPKSGDDGGQYGVSISDPAGVIGKYRYLLFDAARTESEDSYGNTFYSEINVIAADHAAGEKPAPETAGVQVSLAAFFDHTGISADGAEFSGGLDGSGSACSSNLLGTAQVWNGVRFVLGTAGASNAVTCAGQTIPLPAGKFSALKILATAVNGDQEAQTFTVAVAGDQAGLTITQSISDWFTPENYPGETQAVTMAYRNQSDGTKDERTFCLYGYTLSLGKTNAVKSLKLPDNSSVKVFAVTLVP